VEKREVNFCDPGAAVTAIFGSWPTSIVIAVAVGNAPNEAPISTSIIHRKRKACRVAADIERAARAAADRINFPS
jgi:hypothetical protein